MTKILAKGLAAGVFLTLATGVAFAAQPTLPDYCTSDSLTLPAHMRELSFIADRMFSRLDKLDQAKEEKLLADDLQLARRHLYASFRHIPARLQNASEEQIRIQQLDYQRYILRATDLTLAMEQLLVKGYTAEPDTFRRREKITQLALELQKVISQGHCKFRGC